MARGDPTVVSSSCDSFGGSGPSDRVSSASAGSSAALGAAGFAWLGFAEGGDTGGGDASAAAGRVPPGGSRRFGCFGRSGDDRLADTLDVVVAETSRCQQLLGAGLRAGEDGTGLGASPLERLLDLGPCRVGELGRLVPRLLEQPVALGLGLAQLLRRVAVRVREQLARLVARVVQHLGPLALALLAIAFDLGFAVLLLAPRRRTSSSVFESCASEAFCASASTVSANSAAERIRCRASIRTA